LAFRLARWITWYAPHGRGGHINLTTLANGDVHASASVNGQQVDSLLSPAVSPAWGSYMELLVAILVAIGVFTQRAVVVEDARDELPPLVDKA
jgi:hypothetical protein